MSDKKEVGLYHINVLSIFLIRAVLWIPAKIFVFGFLRMSVYGKENLKELKTGRVLFAANHVSEIDPFAFQYTLSFFCKFVPLYFVSLSKKYYSFSKYKFRSFIYGGLFFRLMGAYPVYKGLHDFEKAFVNHIKILQKNHSILIFPEGKMIRDGIGKAKPGIIFLAKRTNAKIVPIKIEGVEGLTFLDIIFMRKKITIKFGSPVESDVFTGKNEKLTTEEMTKWSEFIMHKVRSL